MPKSNVVSIAGNLPKPAPAEVLQIAVLLPTTHAARLTMRPWPSCSREAATDSAAAGSVDGHAAKAAGAARADTVRRRVSQEGIGDG
jgi:hypothetical protein